MKQSRLWTPFLLAVSLSAALVGAGCDDEDDEDDTPRQSTSARESGSDSDFPSGKPSRSAGEPTSQTLELVTLTEPKENAFTVLVPSGWKNQGTLVQVYDQKRPIVTAVSPSGDTFLFLGDPQMPAFTIPTPQMNAGSAVAKLFPTTRFAEFKPADAFFTDYLKKKFGKLADFRIVGTAPNPAVQKAGEEGARARGMDAKITACLIAFDYRDNGKLIRSLINGMTMRIGGVWIADISGVSSTDDPIKYNDMLLRMARSYKTNPDWQARQQQQSRERHEATMAMIQANTAAMTRRHEANMAAIQASAARHQRHMADLHAAGDAQMEGWKQQQAQNDASHERFLNYIKGENTVVNSSGSTFQVESGQDQYFRNKSDSSFVGTDSTKELEDLRKIWGLNPDDYEAVRVKP